METSGISPNASQLTAEEEAVLASEVLKIIGGVGFRSVPTPEEPEGKDGWSLEEGDDSVFYSDEEVKDSGPSFGGNEYQRLANSEADHEVVKHRKDEDVDSDRENSKKEHRTQKMTFSETDCDLNLQKFEHTTHVETLPEHNTPTEKVNPNVKPEVVVQDAHTSNIDLLGALNEQSYQKPNGGPTSQHLYDRPLQLQAEPEGNSSGFPVGFHQLSAPGYSTFPLTTKQSHSLQESFNHLTSSRYSTVSYRRIRRGNTRQKIEEFECIIKNL